jgi:uncharacterized protein YtpQ (UPF0354 family)
VKKWFKEWSKRSRLSNQPDSVISPLEVAVVASSEELIRRMTLPTTDRETFFLLYSRVAEQKYGATQLSFAGDGALCMKRADGKEQTIHLTNLWIMCKSAPEDARTTIERHMTLIDGNAASESLRREQIVPMIKDESYFAAVGTKLEVVRQHLAADLYIVYAADSEHSMRTIKPSEIKTLEIEEAQVLALAIENLRGILPEIECHDQGSWHFFSAGTDYAASLLLLENVWEFAATQVEGDVVAVVPTRDSVMFTGAQSQEGLAEIRRLANEIVSSGHHVISSTLLRRVNGGWKAFD